MVQIQQITYIVQDYNWNYKYFGKKLELHTAFLRALKVVDYIVITNL